MPHITADISLGSIAIVVTLIGIAINIGARLGTITQTVAQHANMLAGQSARMDRYEQGLNKNVGDVQRLVGRIEATQDRIDRNTGRRQGEGYQES